VYGNTKCGATLAWRDRGSVARQLPYCAVLPNGQIALVTVTCDGHHSFAWLDELNNEPIKDGDRDWNLQDSVISHVKKRRARFL
jgi:hypothetical protein